MAETLRGVGVIWGVGAMTMSGVVASTDFVQSADFAWQSEKEELRGNDGEVRGLCYYNSTKTLTITVVPSAVASGGIAGAVTSAAGMLIDPGTPVTLTDPKSADAAGVYILESCRLRRTNNGIALIEMDLIRYATDLSATVS